MLDFIDSLTISGYGLEFLNFPLLNLLGELSWKDSLKTAVSPSIYILFPNFAPWNSSEKDKNWFWNIFTFEANN